MGDSGYRSLRSDDAIREVQTVYSNIIGASLLVLSSSWHVACLSTLPIHNCTNELPLKDISLEWFNEVIIMSHFASQGLGGLLIGMMCDLIGRKYLLIILSIILIILTIIPPLLFNYLTCVCVNAWLCGFIVGGCYPVAGRYIYIYIYIYI
eukprot:GHVR01067759.1.p1 GENE.GHVR01067759.1~~GHVR01067759.1.p1  ORF type:complete len:151 (+),score=31.45 GHVR01067759.1:48-500(+)